MLQLGDNEPSSDSSDSLSLGPFPILQTFGDDLGPKRGEILKRSETSISGPIVFDVFDIWRLKKTTSIL